MHKKHTPKKNVEQSEFVFVHLFDEKDETLSIEEKINQQANQDNEITDKDEIEKLSSWSVSPVLSNNLSRLLKYSGKKFDEVISWTPRKRFENKLSNQEIDETTWKMWASNNILTPLIDADESQAVLDLRGEQLTSFIRSMSKKHFDDFCEFAINTESKDENYFWERILFKTGTELIGRIGCLRMGIKPHERTWTGKYLREKCLRKIFKTSSNDHKEVGLSFINCFIGENAITDKWTLEYRGGLWRINIFTPQKQSIYIEETETNI